MEKEEITNIVPAQSLSDFFELALWQWQSDVDPWKEKDPTKWAWQNYSDDNCRIIEQAFFQNKEVVDLNKDYEVDLKNMRQVRKDDRHRMRRVRRQEKSRFLMEISEPIAIVRDQKTMNEAFGTIQQFLDYIMKRTPEAYGLYQRLKHLPLGCNSAEFEDVIQEVINCIERGAQKREKAKAKLVPSEKTCLEQGKDILNEIKNNSKSLGDFLKTILKIYTMETFIYPWLNELLRSEDWEEINVLTPYLVCLVYTFKLSEYIIKHQGPQGFMNTLIGFVGKQKLYLYRGAALTKEHIDLYRSAKVEYFSWNGVTSASRIKDIALKFIQLSLANAKALNQSKIGAYFVIETDFASSEDCEGMIDTAKLSKFPKEQEVILAPGTVFKLIKTRLYQKNVYEITLRVVKKFEEAKESVAFLGAIQDQAILKDKAIIDGLPSLKSMKLLDLLKGNQLIRKLEIKNSGIEEHIIEDIENMRMTTNVKKQDVKLIDNTIVVSGLSILAQYFTPENLNSLIISNKIRFQKRAVKFEEKKKDWKANIILREETLKKLQKDGQLKELWENIKQDIQATSLEVSMINIQIKNSEFRDFLESIKEMKHLESLTLRINSNNIETAEDLTHFCGVIESLHALKRFSIGFSVSEQGLKSFSKALEYLTSLQHLHIDLRSCKQISDEGLDNLKTAFLSLKSLQHLSLNLKNCDKISDVGLNHLKTALQSLTSCQYLSLDFTDCIKISDDGFIHFITSLGSLRALQHLFLDFNLCSWFTNEGLSHLKNTLLSLTALKYLSLDFPRCNRISDEGLNELQLGLAGLKSLQYLSLNFSKCFKISNEGLRHLSFVILSLKSLENLSLDLTKCERISDEGIKHLNMGLKSLQHLSLKFKDCDRITDEGLSHIKFLLAPLSSLQHFSLDLRRFENISNLGLINLLDELTRLKSLKNLSLNFGGLNEFSNIMLSNLKIVLVSLTPLEYLSLDFRWCDQITNEGLKSLASSLTTHTSLQNLVLNFSSCQQVSDGGLNHLKKVLVLLTDLKKLSLNFSGCGKITNKAVNNLKDDLKLIQDLECHHSDFIKFSC